MNKRIIVLALVTVFIFTGKIFSQGQQYSQFSPESDLALDEFIKKKMEETGIIGLGAAIIVDKKVVWIKGYGFAYKEIKVLVFSETTMNPASVSKTFTGVAFMRELEAGDKFLDDAVNNYLRFKIINPFFPNEKITLRHLAARTSSISSQSLVERDLYTFDQYTAEPEDFLKSYLWKSLP